jgi:hypothetical protein
VGGCGMRSHRVLRSVVLAVAGLAVSSAPALAGREWCATDPILQFADGSRVQWVTEFDSANLASLTGPVRFSYEVPSNIGPIVVSSPWSAAPEVVFIAYNGKPWSGKGPVPVKVTVTVSATTEFTTVTTVRGNVAGDHAIHGDSNTAVKANATVNPSEWSDLAGANAVVARLIVTRHGDHEGPLPGEAPEGD